MLNTKAKQYPSHYSDSRMAKYKDAVAKHKVSTDCIGLAKGYMWTNGGENVIESIGLATPKFTNKYASNGCPDQSANGMFSYAKNKGMKWGAIGTIPEVPGIAVRYDGHVGYYVGNGKVVEARGFNYGVVKTNLKDRPWTHWYYLPFITYEKVVNPTPITPDPLLGSRTLQKGCKGEDVKELQKSLMKLGYSLPKFGADGDYGSETITAVKAFQKTVKITVDGIYNANTHKALMAKLSDLEHKEPEVPVKQKKVIITGDSVYVRKGSGTQYSILTVARKNATYDYVATASNGWNAITISGQTAWVSGSYSKVVDA